MNAATAAASLRRAIRHAERLLLLLGVVTLGYCGWSATESAVYQAVETRELDAILAAGPPRAPRPVRLTRGAVPATGSTIGRIEIPRLGVSTIVKAGSDARTLQLAVGHIPGTALPGEGGNVGLAGHRDTFFRRLRDIAPNDRISLVTPEGRFHYRVQRTDVVSPADVWVLDDTPAPSLTLVTCYPFHYIGAAPDRFVVRAILTSPGPVAADPQ